MHRKQKALVFFALGIAILLPVFSYAQTQTSGAGLVPCGVTADSPLDETKDYNTATECQACHLVQLTQNIIHFLIGLAVSVAVLMFAWAGILFFTSGASPDKINKGKRIFGQALFGFLLALCAWLIINTLLFILVDQERFPESSWFEIECTENRKVVEDNLNDIISGALGIVSSIELPPSAFYGTNPDGSYSGVYQCPAGYDPIPNSTECYNAEAPSPVEPGLPVGGLTPPDGLFDYAPGIAAQRSHASPTLNSLLSCMVRRVPGNVGLITSISDSDIVSGARTFQYCATNGQGGGCAHVVNSCHYGGRTCVGQSYAVDFGDENNSLALIQAANACGASAEIHNGNHVHASIGGACGCQ